MADISWLYPITGNYEDAEDWSGLKVPGRHDNVLLNAQGGPAYTVRVGKDASAKTLTIGPDDFKGKTYFPTLLIKTSIYSVKKVLSEGKISLQTGAQFDGYRVINEGLISAGSGVEVVDFRKVINRKEIISAVSSHLLFKGKVKGSGTVDIQGGSIDFQAEFNQYVTFAGGGVLELAEATDYTKAVAGFSVDGSSALDLDDVKFVESGEATFSGSVTNGVLTVSDGDHSAHIHLKGDYLSANFVCSSDGHGGTDVVATSPQTPCAVHFVSAMAAMTGHGVAAGLIDARGVSEGGRVMLAAPRIALA